MIQEKPPIKMQIDVANAKIVRPTLRQIEVMVRVIRRTEKLLRKPTTHASYVKNTRTTTAKATAWIESELAVLKMQREAIQKYLTELPVLGRGCALPKKKQRELGILPSVENEIRLKHERRQKRKAKSHA